MAHKIIVGIDEVGRGCWAGPLLAGAVILGKPIEGLADSKVLTAARRSVLSDLILQQASSYGIGWVSPGEVDELGLTSAVRLAMQRALDLITLPYDEVIIDGSYNFLPDAQGSRAVIKADGSIPSVSAASIIAKVARDEYMSRVANVYPGYGFEKHVGYGTAQHIAALQALGVSDLHRKSYKPIEALLQ